jgi:inosine-uridine nucleoside N-ribohydrolase
MTTKQLVIDGDPGLGDAVAMALALFDPRVEVLGLTATAGVVSGAQANRNVHLLVNHLDLTRNPRLGWCSDDLPPCEAVTPNLPLHYLHGPCGMGEHSQETSLPHHRVEAAKVIVELVKANPHKVTVLTLGPMTNVALACELLPDFPQMVKSVMSLAGVWQGYGDVTASSELNTYVDPESLKRIIHKQVPLTLVPIDIASQLQLTFNDLERLPLQDKLPLPTFLSKLLPYGLRSCRHHLGQEGLSIPEVVAMIAVSRPEFFTSHAVHMDVETRGELTRGMIVFDRRPNPSTTPRNHVIQKMERDKVLEYFHRIIGNSVR